MRTESVMHRNGMGEVHFILMHIRRTGKQESDKSTFGSIQMRTTIHHISKPLIPLAQQKSTPPIPYQYEDEQSINHSIN